MRTTPLLLALALPLAATATGADLDSWSGSGLFGLGGPGVAGLVPFFASEDFPLPEVDLEEDVDEELDLESAEPPAGGFALTHLPVTPRGGRRYLGSAFGPRRAPRAGASRNHAGIDIPYPTGTPILAAADGVVAQVGRHAKAGRVITIRHADGHFTRYLHLSRQDVRVRQQVVGGQRIGALGATGNVTGPHLHFEFFRLEGGRRRYLDPEPRFLELGAPPRAGGARRPS